MNKLAQVFYIMIFSLVTIVATSSDSQAIPAFARQTQMECASCHFQHPPALNSFGRAFKAGGYVDAAVDLIEGDHLSIPQWLPVSLVTKIRIQKQTNATDTGTGTTVGEFQNPDELALLIGGRGGEHLGFFIEDAFSKAGQFKVDVNYAVGAGKIHVIPFFTDAFGPAFNMELMNTGAVRGQRSMEDRKSISTHQILGLGSGNANGVAFAYTQPEFMVDVAQYIPVAAGSVGVDAFASYLRVAAFFDAAGFDIGVGIQSVTGDPEVDGVKVAKFAKSGLDAQAQGEAGGMPLGVYFNYTLQGKDDTDNGYGSDVTGLSLNAELGVIPHILSLGLGYAAVSADGFDANDIFVGGYYELAQNLELYVGMTTYGGDWDTQDPLTTIMLEAVF